MLWRGSDTERKGCLKEIETEDVLWRTRKKLSKLKVGCRQKIGGGKNETEMVCGEELSLKYCCGEELTLNLKMNSGEELKLKMGC